MSGSTYDQKQLVYKLTLLYKVYKINNFRDIGDNLTVR